MTKTQVVIITTCIILTLANIIGLYVMWDKINIIDDSIIYHYNSTHKNMAMAGDEIELSCNDESCNDFYGIMGLDGTIEIIERN